MPVKHDKSEVNYSPGKPGSQCRLCEHFRPPVSPASSAKCRRVNGSISPQYWCELFRKELRRRP